MYVPTGRPIRDKSNGSHFITLLILIRTYNNVRTYRHIFHIMKECLPIAIFNCFHMYVQQCMYAQPNHYSSTYVNTGENWRNI